MRLRDLFCSLILSLPAHGWPAFAAVRPVVVEKVESGTPAERAGLRAEDRLFAWSGSGQTGTLRSPLELAWVEVEQAPRGPVVLHGLRGSESHDWVLNA